MATIQEGGVHALQAYIQQCLHREANGHAAILPTPEELDLMLANTDNDTRNLLIDSLVSLVGYRSSLEYAETLLARFDDDSDLLRDADDDDDDEEEDEDAEEEQESLGFQFTAGQFDDFIQTLARRRLRYREGRYC